MDEFEQRRSEILELCQRTNNDLAAKGPGTRELADTADAVREAIKRARAGRADLPRMSPRAARRFEQLHEHLQDADRVLPPEQVAELESLIQEVLPNV